MKSVWEELVESLCTDEEKRRALESAEMIAQMGCLMIDAVMAAHRVAADRRGVYQIDREYPPITYGEFARAFVFIFEDGLSEPPDVNRIRDIANLYRTRSPERWIEASSWRPGNR
jgi:hypothetical protein